MERNIMSRKQRAFKRENKNNTNTNTIQFNEYVTKKQNVTLIPRSVNQEQYIDQLLSPDNLIVFATGPAGTGKTMLAVLAALKAYKEGTIDKIIVTRPAVGVDDEKHGFLPGDLNAKMEPWTKPIFDVIHEYYNPKTVAGFLEEGIIEISPLAFMRGRNFHKSYIIADEVQNTTENQMKMLLTRIGEGSKMVLTGDLDQTDIHKKNGLKQFVEILSQNKSNLITYTHFETKDIQRSEAVREVLRLYKG